MYRRKKILFVITQGLWGGAQRYVFDLARSLPTSYTLTVAIGEANGAQDLQKELTALNIPVVQLRHLKRPISPLHDLLAVRELKQLYTKEQPDIVHLNSSKAGIVGSIAASMLNTSQRPHVIYTAHGWVFDEPIGAWRQALYRFCERTTAQRKDAVIVLSEKDKKTAEQILNIPPKQVVRIPIGIEYTPSPWTKETARIELAKQNVSLSSDTYLVGTIANLFPTKGIDILLNAIAQKQTELPNVQFVIIGDGPERSALEHMKTRLNLSNVHFLGFKKNATDYLPAFDVFVLPSVKEGMPYTILEALVYPLPIVATRVGALPELLLSSHHMLVPPNDADTLGSALVVMHQKHSLVSNINITPQQNNLETMILQTTSLYDSLLTS